jgi:type II secretory pathway pseudopilin PulG
MARAFVLIPVQTVTPIMSLAMTLLELVVALVVLDHD